MRSFILIFLGVTFIIFNSKAEAVTYNCKCDDKTNTCYAKDFKWKFDLVLKPSGKWLISTFGKQRSISSYYGRHHSRVTIFQNAPKTRWRNTESYNENFKCFKEDVLKSGYCSIIWVRTTRWMDAGIGYDYFQCKIPNSKLSVSVLHAAFNKQLKNERKSIQSYLFNSGFYDSKIDGLYGPNTKAAIESYAKSIGKEDHLKSEKLAKELLQSLLSSNEQPLVEEKEKKKGLF